MKKGILFVSLLAFVSVLAINTPALNARSGRHYFTAYAAPMTWGPWVTVASHLGTVSYTVSYRVVGKTKVIGQIEYYGLSECKLVSRQFDESITIKTGPCVSNVRVRFKGMPTGSAIEGAVN